MRRVNGKRSAVHAVIVPLSIITTGGIRVPERNDMNGKETGHERLFSYHPRLLSTSRYFVWFTHHFAQHPFRNER